jgi:hypothetical protein
LYMMIEKDYTSKDIDFSQFFILRIMTIDYFINI